MSNEVHIHNNINLHELGVLITRPIHQAQTLFNLIQKHNGRPILFPAITIELIINSVLAQELLSQNWDIIIYTSFNAVQFAAQLNNAINSPTIICIGTATATALKNIFQREPNFIPERQDSEGLLNLPILNQPINQKILIVRGIGGRTLLNETLIARGAYVSIAEVYQRSIPTIDAKAILEKWEQDVQVIIATSGEILDNLISILGTNRQMKLFNTPLITVSERLYNYAQNLGFIQVMRATNASDVALLTTLNDFASNLCHTP